MADRWTYRATVRGFMFYLDGKPQGGAGIMPTAKAPTGRAALKQLESNADYCKRECRRRNAALAEAEKAESGANGTN